MSRPANAVAPSTHSSPHLGLFLEASIWVSSGPVELSSSCDRDAGGLGEGLGHGRVVALGGVDDERDHGAADEAAAGRTRRPPAEDEVGGGGATTSSTSSTSSRPPPGQTGDGAGDAGEQAHPSAPERAVHGRESAELEGEFAGSDVTESVTSDLTTVESIVTRLGINAGYFLKI